MIRTPGHIESLEWCPYRLDFSFEARTSRGSMYHKDTYLLRAKCIDGRIIYAEVPLFKGLSDEDTPEFEEELSAMCQNPSIHPTISSLAFGLESIYFQLDTRVPTTSWQRGECGIPINGLIWMGDKSTMQERIRAKLAAGFRVLKLKIGGIDFDDELELLKNIRAIFGADSLEIRLDANGSFNADNAMGRLDRLAKYHIHSIEQPIRAGQTKAMARLCRQSPIDIALDEELIGIRTLSEKTELINAIRPRYLILKPALCGGFKAADEYIGLAGEGNWWATSALESNIGLYAIGCWLSTHKISMPQGLGTGRLYSNNIVSPLYLSANELYVNPSGVWNYPENLLWRK